MTKKPPVRFGAVGVTPFPLGGFLLLLIHGDYELKTFQFYQNPAEKQRDGEDASLLQCFLPPCELSRHFLNDRVRLRDGVMRGDIGRIVDALLYIPRAPSVALHVDSFTCCPFANEDAVVKENAVTCVAMVKQRVRANSFDDHRPRLASSKRKAK